MWRYFEFNYWFIKNEKNHFSKKTTFFHVFKEFLDDYFLYKKQILIMWIIREWRVNVIDNILFSNVCLHIGQHIFIFSQHYSTFGQHLILSAVLESNSPPPPSNDFFEKIRGGKLRPKFLIPKIPPKNRRLQLALQNSKQVFIFWIN